MLRRLNAEQPETFAFTRANQAWAEAEMTKYPEGRQASAIIALMWRAQEQEGWLTRPAIEHIAEMLGLAYIRALEVATFYFMFQLQPVGKTAHIQICGTTSCMICGAEDLVAVCRDKIAKRPHELSEDGRFSWEEVECLGACSNAPMAQIGKDYYEDLTPEGLSELLDAFRADKVPTPGSQSGRFASEPLDGVTSLTGKAEDRHHERNASVALAEARQDTLKRIDGTEVPLTTPWHRAEQADSDPQAAERDPKLGPAGPDGPQGGKVHGAREADRERGDASDGVAEARGSEAEMKGRPDEGDVAPDKATDGAVAGKGEAGSAETSGPVDTQGEPEGEQTAAESGATGKTVRGGKGARTESGQDTENGRKPATLDKSRAEGADNLKRIKGIGPKLEKVCNSMGFWHFDQIAAWTAEEVAWVDSNLEGFKGRVTRDEWVKQAKVLARGEETEFSSRTK